MVRETCRKFISVVLDVIIDYGLSFDNGLSCRGALGRGMSLLVSVLGLVCHVLDV